MAINYQKVGWDTSKFVNPTNMNQMDAGIKAACDAADQINTNLETKNLKTYVGYTQVGMTSANTVSEIMAAMPTASMLIGQIGAENSVLNQSLPTTKAGELTIKKSTSVNRGIAEFRPYAENKVYTNAYINGAFAGWEQIATNSDLAKVENKVKSMNIGANTSKELSMDAYTCLVMCRRRGSSVNFIVNLEYWDSTVVPIFNTIPSTITITKSSNSKSFTITNNGGDSIAVMVIG